MKKREDSLPITKILLHAIAIAGVLSMAVLAPNAIQSMTLFGYGKRQTGKNFNRIVNNTFHRLLANGEVAMEATKEGKNVHLTSKGEEKLLRYQLGDLQIQQPRKWDRKWRIVIFDVYEKSRAKRNWLREELRNLGFVKLQHSVWVHPYECEEVIKLLTVHTRLGRGVLYIIGEKIEGDQQLRRYFNLV